MADGFEGDGRCFIEPQLWHGYTVGVATQRYMVFGALYVIDDCVDTPNPRGGIVWDIGRCTQSSGLSDSSYNVHDRQVFSLKRKGGDDHLYLTVSRYDPHVICGPEAMDPSLQSSCQQIIDTMPASENPVLFGPRDDPRTFIGLPYTIVSGKQLPICTLGL